MYENMNIWERAESIFNDNREEIINLYENGKMTVIQLEDKFGISHSTLDRKLRKNGIEIIDRRYKNQILTWRNKKNKIISDYQNGLMSLEQLKKKYNISIFLLRKNLRKNKIKLRGRTFGKIVNLESNENLFYILGVLRGDGSAFTYGSYPDKKYTICRIMLDCKDLDFAKAFQNALKNIGLNVRLNTKRKELFKQGFCYRVDCYSKILYNWNKNFNLKSILDEKKEHKIAFIRGMFDSDGCNCKKNNIVRITTTRKDFALFLKKLLETTNFKSTIYGGKQNSGYCKEKYDVVILGGKSENERFLKTIKPNIARKKYGG